MSIPGYGGAHLVGTRAHVSRPRYIFLASDVPRARDVSRSVTCNESQDDATVKCWGSNDFGQLGYGDTWHRGDHRDGWCPTRATRGCVC